jgi:hypothetical protein
MATLSTWFHSHAQLTLHIHLGVLDVMAGVQWSAATTLMCLDSLDGKISLLAVWSLLIAIWATVTTLLAWHSRNMADLQRAFTLGVERGALSDPDRFLRAD